MSGTHNLNQSFVVCLLCLIVIAYFYPVDCAIQANYSTQERIALDKFRELTSDALYNDYMKSDPYLIRWLRARNFNLEAASGMLQETVKWRKNNRIDEILKESIHEFQSPPYYDDGVDHEGNLVVTLLPGRVDMRKAILAGKRQITVRFWDQLLEKMEIHSMESLGILKSSNNSLSTGSGQASVIMDMQGYNFRQHACLPCIGVYAEWFEHMEKYYPGYATHFIMINVPRTALPAIDLLKSIMSPETMKVFEAFGSNRNEWLPTIRKLIPVDQVRANLGGTKTD